MLSGDACVVNTLAPPDQPAAKSKINDHKTLQYLLAKQLANLHQYIII